MKRLVSISDLSVSEGTRRRNPQLFPGGVGVPVAAQHSGQRLRQDPKSLLNALETRLQAYLAGVYPGMAIRAQAKRYRLGNGIWYKPDFTAIVAGVEHAWEAKGPRAFRGGFENLKVAAAQYPEAKFILIWEEAGVWTQQEILS